jgi:hypothetical protein
MTNAILRAYRAGIRLQRVELLLPLIGATDLDDWPGGIQQQFKAAQPMVEKLLLKLKMEPGLEGRLNPSFLDTGDAVALWSSENISCAVFATGETLPAIRKDSEGKKLTVVINPQWNASSGPASGNIFSDFGFGQVRIYAYMKTIEAVGWDQ